MSEAKKDARISQMDTYMLESKLANVRNLEEYEAIMQQALSQDELWKEEITALITETGLTRERIAAGCGAQRRITSPTERRPSGKMCCASPF